MAVERPLSLRRPHLLTTSDRARRRARDAHRNSTVIAVGMSRPWTVGERETGDMQVANEDAVGGVPRLNVIQDVNRTTSMVVQQ